MRHNQYRFCQFTVMDKPERFKPADLNVVEHQADDIDEGLYYVETTNHKPLQGNGWYYHNIIIECLLEDIITSDDIKYVIKSSLVIKRSF